MAAAEMAAAEEEAALAAAVPKAEENSTAHGLLRALVRESGLLYGLTHTYTGYPLVKEARERIAGEKADLLEQISILNKQTGTYYTYPP